MDEQPKQPVFVDSSSRSSHIGAPDALSLLELRASLHEAGFRIETNHMRDRIDECTWYAYKRSTVPARECETNDGKRLQIVVTPHAFTISGHRHESADVEVAGQFGQWWKLQAYGVSFSSLLTELPAIEASLAAAWNALDTAPPTTAPQAKVVPAAGAQKPDEQEGGSA